MTPFNGKSVIADKAIYMYKPTANTVHSNTSQYPLQIIVYKFILQCSQYTDFLILENYQSTNITSIHCASRRSNCELIKRL